MKMVADMAVTIVNVEHRRYNRMRRFIYIGELLEKISNSGYAKKLLGEKMNVKKKIVKGLHLQIWICTW